NGTEEKQLSEAAINKFVAQSVADALAEYEPNQNSGNGNGKGNDNGSHDSGGGGERTPHTTREYTYSEFFKCQSLNFKGTEGAVGLAQWFEKMESESANALWKAKHDAAYALPWKTLMKMMTKKYCPMSELMKLESELWNLVVKEKVEKYTGGLPDSIQGSVMASKPKTLKEAILLYSQAKVVIYECPHRVEWKEIPYQRVVCFLSGLGDQRKEVETLSPSDCSHQS
ncbi:hypothetical protein Tco_0128064, partial [Tanacetum coccineum]